MPKTKKQLQQHRIGGARCPNPTCTSNGKFFATMKQLQGHISHKPDCLAYMVQLRNSLQSNDMNMTDCVQQTNYQTQPTRRRYNIVLL
jgi:hypothetical protein